MNPRRRQTMTTIDTITDAQITALRSGAGEAFDAETVAACDRALAGDLEARAECASIIASAEAMADED
jgi:hypothetical protein